MIAPCKDCPDRSVECHGKCEKYLSFVQERERIRNERMRKKEIDEAIMNNARELMRRKVHIQFQRKGLH